MAIVDVNMNEVLISPLSSMVRELSAGVAAAQRELDAAALATQAQLAAEHPATAGARLPGHLVPDPRGERR